MLHPDSAIDLAVDEEVPVFLIVEQGLRLGRIERRVADLVPPDVKVVIEEAADLSRAIGQVGDLDSADQDVLEEVHAVVAEQLHLQPRVPGPHLGHHG